MSRPSILSAIALILACALPLAGGCDATSEQQSPWGSGTNTASSGSGASTSGTGTDTGIGGGLVGNPDGGMEGTGCEMVDFLFIVDNSVSMQDQQAALVASFPGFMQSIQTTLSASDYHIMVTDTDDWGRCTKSNCKSGDMSADSLCINAAKGYACKTEFDKCDKTIGAGVVHPAGKAASNELCNIEGGNRYIVDGQPDLADTFACMATVGLAGHPSERPMDSMVATMSAELNGAEGCNAGFLRDNAILVITFISDDPNVEDAGMPQDWYDAVVAAKGGNADAVVVLGLTPAFDGCGSKSKPNKGKHWSEFIAMWGDHGLEASVCNEDYTPFFDQAVAIIDEACDEFNPPT